jgi:hypothetical protein
VKRLPGNGEQTTVADEKGGVAKKKVLDFAATNGAPYITNIPSVKFSRIRYN